MLIPASVSKSTLSSVRKVVANFTSIVLIVAVLVALRTVSVVSSIVVGIVI